MQGELPDWFRQALLAWLAKFHFEPRSGMQDFVKVLVKEIKRPIRISEPYRGYAQMIVIG